MTTRLLSVQKVTERPSYIVSDTRSEAFHSCTPNLSTQPSRKCHYIQGGLIKIATLIIPEVMGVNNFIWNNFCSKFSSLTSMAREMLKAVILIGPPCRLRARDTRVVEQIPLRINIFRRGQNKQKKSKGKRKLRESLQAATFTQGSLASMFENHPFATSTPCSNDELANDRCVGSIERYRGVCRGSQSGRDSWFPCSTRPTN